MKRDETTSMNAGQTRHLALCLLAVFTLLAAVPAAEAYVGPGAGFAFVSSFFCTFYNLRAGIADFIDLAVTIFRSHAAEVETGTAQPG